MIEDDFNPVIGWMQMFGCGPHQEPREEMLRLIRNKLEEGQEYFHRHEVQALLRALKEL